MDKAVCVDQSGMATSDEMDRPAERHYYLDWLRVGALVSVFLFHAVHIFAPLDWHVNNDQRSQLTLLFMGFVNGWSMPLFFVLAGAGAWFSLERCSPAQFCWKRCKRLVVPYVFGVAVIILPQKYFEALHQETFSGSFIAYLPHYFRGITFYPHVGQLGNIGYHLWFIAFLFLYSVVTLPLLLHYRAHKQRRMPGEADGKTRLPLLAFAGPLMIVQVTLGVRHAGHLGWSNFVYWMLFYVYGFLLMSNRANLKAIQKSWKGWLVSGGICFAFMMACLISGRAIKWMFAPEYSVGNVLFLLLICLNAWSWVLALIGLAQHYLNFNHRFLTYTNTAVLPFYILHQTVLVLVGYYVVQMDSSMPFKFLLIVGISLLVILSIYESLIKRVAPVRFLFGMK